MSKSVIFLSGKPLTSLDSTSLNSFGLTKSKNKGRKSNLTLNSLKIKMWIIESVFRTLVKNVHNYYLFLTLRVKNISH